MDEKTQRFVAEQLRKPSGAFAAEMGERMNAGNRLLNFRAFAGMTLTPGAHILELGMGNGAFVRDLLALAPDLVYTGIDYSPEMVDAANLANKGLIESGRVRIIEAVAEKLPFDAGTFDVALSVNTVYFWDDFPAVAGELHRVLRRDGELTLGLRPRSVMQQYPFVQNGFAMFSAAELCQALGECDFSDFRISE
ncbi:MAG TPA: class I SAM-dependent methyltransferase, partial [Calditrichia bacterium]|nr:class I SAM-dependent methyltransferase [Calditrichia bacterium]